MFGWIIDRNPVAQSTDGSRGKIGFRQGRHAWEVMWEGPLGTVAVVGISTKEAALQCPGYAALLGADAQSWGWNLVDNHLLHDGDAIGSYPLLNNAPKYQVGERIRVILDCDDNTLSFEKNYEFLGVAFRGNIFTIQSMFFSLQGFFSLLCYSHLFQIYLTKHFIRLYRQYMVTPKCQWSIWVIR